MYHRGPSRCWAGTGVMYSPARPDNRQFCEMWRSSECDLYCVRTQIRKISGIDEIRQDEVDQPVAHRRREPPVWPGPRSAGRAACPPRRPGQCPARVAIPSWVKPIGTRVGAASAFADSSSSCSCRQLEFGTTALRVARRRYYRRAHAGGDDDSGVSARGLRRRRRTRHRTRRPTAPAVRGRRALHGRAAAGRFVAPTRPRAQGRQPGAVDAVGGPGDGQRRRRRRPSCTRTPGTPGWPATWPRCCTASRTC